MERSTFMPTDSPRTVPLMVFDGDCSFCRLWIAYWRNLTSGTIDYAPYQETAGRFPDIPLENFKRAVQLILPDGEVLSAAQAVARSLADVPEYGWMWWTYHHVPGFAALAELLYRCVAAHRSAAYHATVFFWGKDFELRLGQKINHILRTPVQFCMPLLASKAFDLGHRQPLDTNSVEAILDFVEFERLDDCFNLFHRISHIPHPSHLAQDPSC